VSSKKSSDKRINAQEENLLKNTLIHIDRITKNAEEKILLEDSIKSIIKGSDNIIDHIKLMDKEKRKELIDIYNKILDGLKEKVAPV